MTRHRRADHQRPLRGSVVEPPNWTNRVAATVAALAAGACLVPAIAGNLDAAAFKGESTALTIAYVVSVFVCAAAAYALSEARQLKDSDPAAARKAKGLVILFAATLTFNLANALGASSASRGAHADPRATLQAKVAILENEGRKVAARVAELSNMAGPESASMFDGRIAIERANRLYARSEECKKVTLGDSQDLCQRIADLQAKRAAAAARDEAEARGRQIADELAKIDVRPGAPDEQVASVNALLAPFATIDDRNVALALDALRALTFELIGAFGPALMFFIYRIVSAPQAEPCRPTISHDAAVRPAEEKTGDSSQALEPSKAQPANSAAAFIAARLSGKRGVKTSAADIRKACEVYCAAEGLIPPSTRTLGEALGVKFERLRGRTVSYANVEIRAAKPNLKLVGADA